MGRRIEREPGRTGASGEVVARIQVGDQSAVYGLPAPQFAGERVGRGSIGAEKPTEPREVVGSLARGDRNDRYIEPAADRLGDVAGRHTFLGDGVQNRARRRVLDRETDQATGVQSMDRGPT